MSLNFKEYDYFVMNGAGNRFIMISLNENQETLRSSEVEYLLVNGWVFDQIIYIKKNNYGFSYTIQNKDGSSAEQCGNGARCVVSLIQQVYRTYSFQLISPAGEIYHTKRDGEIGISLGTPTFIAQHQHSKPNNCYIDLNENEIPYTFVGLGNPHAVIFHEKDLNYSLAEIAQAFNASGHFPEGINVGLGKIINNKTISLKVYERGAGETLACGTGAAAAAVVAIKQFKQNNPTTIHMNGGSLLVEVDQNTGVVWLFGPAEIETNGKVTL
jgi:diaminopimelate epimerase